MQVRVRYAPSPTGLQHIGGIRTALFNYFFARANGGQFILRVEDTDRERYSDEALQDLYETLQWLGLQWDEGPGAGGDFGPYVQSERLALYQDYAKRLIETGKAYYCYCSIERLDRIRAIQAANKMPPGYDRHCRHLTPQEVAEYKAESVTPVIRLMVPLEGSTTFHDEILGDITRENKDISPDPVILKSDGYPTYHLANVVDDHLMNITHILRAQEWIPSGPLHILLYQAFGWIPPKYCHLPMVMGADGQKLSKRHGATAVREFRQAGYLPEALINYVSLLGWAYDDSREFFTKADLEKLFVLEKLHKAPAIFDYKKLEWFNGHYIREKSQDELSDLLLPFLQKAGEIATPATKNEQKRLQQATPLIQERLRFLAEAPALLSFLFGGSLVLNKESFASKKITPSETLAALQEGRLVLETLDEKTNEQLEEALREKANEMGFKLGNLMMPLRIAITGSSISPPLLGSARLLGKHETVHRLNEAIHIMGEKIQ